MPTKDDVCKKDDSYEVAKNRVAQIIWLRIFRMEKTLAKKREGWKEVLPDNDKKEKFS